MTFRKSGYTAMGGAHHVAGSFTRDANGNQRRVTKDEAEWAMLFAMIGWVLIVCWDLLVLALVWPVEAIIRLRFWPPLTHKLIFNPMFAWA